MLLTASSTSIEVTGTNSVHTETGSLQLLLQDFLKGQASLCILAFSNAFLIYIAQCQQFSSDVTEQV